MDGSLSNKLSVSPLAYCYFLTSFSLTVISLIVPSNKTLIGKLCELPQRLKRQGIHLQCRRGKRHWFTPCVGKLPWRRKWQLTPVFLPGKSHEQRNLTSYSLWGCKESDMTEHSNKIY